MTALIAGAIGFVLGVATVVAWFLWTYIKQVRAAQ